MVSYVYSIYTEIKQKNLYIALYIRMYICMHYIMPGWAHSIKGA